MDGIFFFGEIADDGLHAILVIENARPPVRLPKGREQRRRPMRIPKTARRIAHAPDRQFFHPVRATAPPPVSLVVGWQKEPCVARRGAF